MDIYVAILATIQKLCAINQTFEVSDRRKFSLMGRGLQTPGTAEGTFKLLTGQIYPVHNDEVSSCMALARSSLVAEEVSSTAYGTERRPDW
jgi:hypothetical protein